jgi:hypothetical protein
LNAVTATVERIADAEGRMLIRKELREPVDAEGPWAASTDLRHWNYWRRELEVYQDDELRKDSTLATRNGSCSTTMPRGGNHSSWTTGRPVYGQHGRSWLPIATNCSPPSRPCRERVATWTSGSAT